MESWRKECQIETGTDSGQPLEVILAPDDLVENLANQILQEHNQAFEALRDK